MPDYSANSCQKMKIMKENGSFPQRINLLIRLVGTKEKFARLAGVSAVMIGKYEAGRSEPGRDRLIAISRATGVSVAWLATGEGPMYVEGKDLADANRSLRAVVDSTHAQLEHSHDFINRIWKKYLAGLGVSETLNVSREDAELLLVYRLLSSAADRQAVKDFIIERFLEGREAN